jgi:hypothetical protein
MLQNIQRLSFFSILKLSTTWKPLSKVNFYLPWTVESEAAFGKLPRFVGSLVGPRVQNIDLPNKHFNNKPSCTARHPGILQRAMAPSRSRGRHGTSSSIPAPSVPRSGAASPQGVGKATQSRSGKPPLYKHDPYIGFEQLFSVSSNNQMADFDLMYRSTVSSQEICTPRIRWPI